MPAYRFSWDLFDDDTVRQLAVDLGHSGAHADARGFLTSRHARPGDEFVQQTKRTLATVWLPRHERIGAAIVRELFDRGIGPLGSMPTDAVGFGHYVDRCRNTSGLRGLLLDRLWSFGDRDRYGIYEPAGEFVPRFAAIVPARQPLNQPRAYAHQLDAWKAMDGHLVASRASGVFKGVVVMPTGSGKTRTAVHWLLRQWNNGGGHVLWIAHRDELLRQAARTFYALAALADRRDRLRIRIVSGRHCGFHQIDPADDVVLCSVNSLARALDSAREMLQNSKLFVVIDEAHHAPARSYREAIRILEETTSHRLLGLTATPTRTAEQERPELARLFGRTTIYQVSPAELIARELLARPIPVAVGTGVQAEHGMTAVDLEYMRDFHEVAPEVQRRLGQDERRNLAIVGHYVQNAAKYGKTLVFAPDVAGAALLADAFRSRLAGGIEVEYLASYRPDGTAATERDVFERFRDPKSGLNVLVNVDMLTEGVDLPQTQTVFLARPTSSEILLRQMIGRALRGPAAGGHREAYIVSFQDHWQTFRDVLSPIDLVTDMLPQAIAAPVPEGPPALGLAPVAPLEPLPELPGPSWDQILELSRAIRAAVPDPEVDVFEAVPHGMYRLEWIIEDQPVQHFIHVYDHHRTCWNALLAHLRSATAAALRETTPDSLLEEFFGDCDDPLPTVLDVATLLERTRQRDALSPYIPLEGRQQCDPRELAKGAREADMRGSEVDALLAERHSALAKVIYPTAIDFRRAFDDAMRELSFPGEAPPPKGVVLFEPPPSNPLRPGPYHDLGQLMTEMLVRGREILAAELSENGPVAWTRHYIKGWFGMAYWHGPRAPLVRVNCLLDSPDVSADTLRFLLWHEFLHMYLKQGHTPEFRRLERLWPNHPACNREMDGLHEKFGVQYW